jgi:hypothetical protein
MKPFRQPVALIAATTCLLVPAAAAAAETPATTPPTPASTPAAPVAGRLKLTLEKVGGKPLFAGAGRPILVRGVVSPYVAGQSVKLLVTRDGREISSATATVLASTHGTGEFRVSFTSRSAGVVQVRAVHAASTAQLAFSAASPNVRIVNENLRPGSTGASVRLLQTELAALHFFVPVNGVFEEKTGQALIAYRKMTGLERTEYAGSEVFSRLQKGAGTFTVRYPRDGRHVEANLTKQVLVEIEPGGRVRDIYTMSSGKPSTPTVLGRFRVYRKEPGTNSEGMVDSSYFISGYAIHGYIEVPTYAASHGCLRVPIPDAPAIYAWIRYGLPVDVYN